MTALQAIVMAVLQGVTELFPVSSLGHAVILPRLLNWGVDEKAPDWLAYLAVMHLGTSIALFAFFWRDWLNFGLSLVGASGSRAAKDRITFFHVVLATIPAVVAGALVPQAARRRIRRAGDRRGLPDRQRLHPLSRRPDRRRVGRNARSAQLEGRAGGGLRPDPGLDPGDLTLRLDDRRRRRGGAQARRGRALFVPDGRADHSRRQRLRGAEAHEGRGDAGRRWRFFQRWSPASSPI